MALSKINDAEIYYELHGQGEPLILVAGYSCDHLFWDLMIEGLKPFFQVLVFDNRAVGQSKDSGRPLTLQEMADDTMVLVAQLGLKKPNILGQSMGGAIAQLIAKNHAEKINKVVILNSMAHLNARALFAIDSLITLRKDGISLDHLIDASLPWFFSSDFLEQPENVLAVKKGLSSNPFMQSLSDQQRQFKALQAFNSSDWLDQIKVPTLIIAAEEDIISTLSDSLQLVNGIKNAQLKRIAGGHSSPVEKPQEVNQLVIDFIRVLGR